MDPHCSDRKDWMVLKIPRKSKSVREMAWRIALIPQTLCCCYPHLVHLQRQIHKLRYGFRYPTCWHYIGISVRNETDGAFSGRPQICVAFSPHPKLSLWVMRGKRIACLYVDEWHTCTEKGMKKVGEWACTFVKNSHYHNLWIHNSRRKYGKIALHFFKLGVHQ